MKTANTYEEASKMTVPSSHIDYRGPDHEKVSAKFMDRYGVEAISTGDYLLIPCTREIEQDFCYDEERMEEICSEMGLNMDSFEF